MHNVSSILYKDNQHIVLLNITKLLSQLTRLFIVLFEKKIVLDQTKLLSQYRNTEPNCY